MIRLLAIKFADELLERVRRNHHEALLELQAVPAARAKVLKDIELADGISTPVRHSLGQPAFVTVAPPRGAVTSGRIEEIRDTTYDRALFTVLRATGWGATITVDVEVKPA